MRVQRREREQPAAPDVHLGRVGRQRQGDRAARGRRPRHPGPDRAVQAAPRRPLRVGGQGQAPALRLQPRHHGLGPVVQRRRRVDERPRVAARQRPGVRGPGRHVQEVPRQLPGRRAQVGQQAAAGAEPRRAGRRPAHLAARGAQGGRGRHRRHEDDPHHRRAERRSPARRRQQPAQPRQHDGRRQAAPAQAHRRAAPRPPARRALGERRRLHRQGRQAPAATRRPRLAAALGRGAGWQPALPAPARRAQPAPGHQGARRRQAARRARQQPAQRRAARHERLGGGLDPRRRHRAAADHELPAVPAGRRRGRRQAAALPGTPVPALAALTRLDAAARAGRSASAAPAPRAPR